MTTNIALARRTHETWLVRHYTALASELAMSGRYSSAYACQSMADTHRVLAGLWSKVSSTNDPVSAFFAMASQVMRAVVGVVPRQDLSPAASLEAVRAAWLTALEGYNMPLSFSSAPWLERCESIDTSEWRTSILGEYDWRDYVDAMLKTNVGKPLRERQSATVMAYLVQVAGAAGDETMMSAAARWLLISSQADHANGVSITEAAERVLGPVEWIRMAPFRGLLSV